MRYVGQTTYATCSTIAIRQRWEFALEDLNTDDQAVSRPSKGRRPSLFRHLSQASTIKAASWQPLTRIQSQSPHPSPRTRFAHATPNRRRVVHLRTRQRLPRPVPGIWSPLLRPHLSAPSPHTPPSHRQKNPQIRTSTLSTHLFVRKLPDSTTKQHFQHSTSRTAAIAVEQ